MAKNAKNMIEKLEAQLPSIENADTGRILAVTEPLRAAYGTAGIQCPHKAIREGSAGKYCLVCNTSLPN